jgi:CHAT domain-containing protein
MAGRVHRAGGRWIISMKGWPIWLAAAALSASITAATAQTGAYIAPPRTIADVTAILDQERPDPARLARMQAEANAEPSQDLNAPALVKFYYQRAVARQNLGLFQDAISDATTGVAAGLRGDVDVARLRQLLGYVYEWAGDIRRSLEVFHALAKDSERTGKRGYLFSAYRWISFLLIQLGDLDQAQAYLEKNEGLFEKARIWPQFSDQRSSYLAQIEYSRGRLFEARGQLPEAEAAYRRAELLFTEVLARSGETPTRWGTEVVRDNMIASQGLVKARQGRFAEGEADVRRALLRRLGSVGKYNLTTATIVISRFARILLDQGRYAEAEKLIRTQIDIFQALGVTGDTQHFALALSNLASTLTLQGKWSDAAHTYAAIDDASKAWEPARKARLTLNSDYAFTLYNTNRIGEGIAAAERLVARTTSWLGEESVATAYARGALAVGLFRDGRRMQAAQEFKRAIPILISRGRASDNDDEFFAAASEQRTQFVVEAYLTLLANDPDRSAAAVEGFRLAEAIRSRSVQRAFTQSSARAMAGNARLADLARHEQDLTRQIAAQLGLLNNLLATPTERRQTTAVQEIRDQLARLRSEHESARRQLRQEFPVYVALIDPQPPTVDEVRKALKPDEALLSFFFGSRASFVWAVAKAGPIAFAAIDMSADDIAAKVKSLHAALEPHAAMISDIPPFDVNLAYELYLGLLQPVENVWRRAASLIVVTNGALGHLPLSLLPTAPAQMKTLDPLFAGYRDVAWLARTHAVTMVPSLASLRILRQLPPGSPAREAFIGFGDPLFNEREAAEAAEEEAERPLLVAARSAATARSLPLARRASAHTQEAESAELGLLPRLPDTATELRSIALALGSDPAGVLFLGRKATEATVKSMDLTRYRIVAFATHGLVPGDLNGLTQPALAFTSPAVAGVSGDGLLTMEEILALKLDADWVVLSACNTGSAAGAGAEAASGLGRAFFYAGSRALLVTNWSVHSASARELVTDLFRRQASDAKITRSEALRQAMMALADGKGFTNGNGQTLFTHAHPIFWAPYSIIGDGSGQESR